MTVFLFAEVVPTEKGYGDCHRSNRRRLPPAVSVDVIEGTAMGSQTA